MKEFKACLKKDLLEQLRFKNLFIYLALSIGIAILSVVTVVILNTIMANMDFGEAGNILEGLEQLFTNSYSTSLYYFMSYMVTYFAIIVICMSRNLIGKEIANKKWVAPMCSGIKSEKLILSKIIVTTLSVIVACICGFAIHFVGTILLFEADAVTTIWGLLAAYGCFTLFAIFTVAVTICINAIFKKSWVSPLIMIVMLILGTTVMQSVKLGSKTLIMYTPYAFYDCCYTATSLSNMGGLEWLISSLSYVVILALLLFLAVKSNKIKAEK